MDENRLLLNNSFLCSFALDTRKPIFITNLLLVYLEEFLISKFRELILI